MQQQGTQQNKHGSHVNRVGYTKMLSWIARNSKKTHAASLRSIVQGKDKKAKKEKDSYAKVYYMKNIMYTNHYPHGQDKATGTLWSYLRSTQMQYL